WKRNSTRASEPARPEEEKASVGRWPFALHHRRRHSERELRPHAYFIAFHRLLRRALLHPLADRGQAQVPVRLPLHAQLVIALAGDRIDIQAHAGFVIAGEHAVLRGELVAAPCRPAALVVTAGPGDAGPVPGAEILRASAATFAHPA